MLSGFSVRVIAKRNTVAAAIEAIKGQIGTPRQRARYTRFTFGCYPERFERC